MRRFMNTRVYIGSLKDAGDKVGLANNFIRVILNVCSDIDTPYYPDMILMKVGLDDPQDGLAPRNPVREAVRCLDMAVNLALRQDGNVLIHCAAGNNRSPLIAALWASEHCYNVSFDYAVARAQVKDKKPWMVALGYDWKE